MQSYTLLGSPIFHEIRGGKYPTKLRFFLMEHCQEMMAPDYTPAILGKSEAFRMQGNVPGFFAQVNEMVQNPSRSCSH